MAPATSDRRNDMGLPIRMVLYFIAAAASGAGFASFDAEAGDLTVNLDDLAVIIGGVLTYAGTFVASRVAKAKGGAT